MRYGGDIWYDAGMSVSALSETVFLAILSLIYALLGSGYDGNAVQYDAIPTTTAVVSKVIDGDTIDVVYNDGTTARVRYIGIDTPEPYRDGEPACYSAEATAANRTLVEDKKVTLVPDAEETDRFGRLLRYVYVEDTFVQAELVSGGYATTLTIPPNTHHADTLAALEDDAKTAARGLWALCR